MTTMVTDVSEFVAVRNLADSVFVKYRSVHVLRPNAGSAGGGSLFNDVTENWERVIGVNLKGVVWGIKAFVPRMVEIGVNGYVVATSSGAGAEGTSYLNASYGSTKNGVLFPPLAATNLETCLS